MADHYGNAESLMEMIADKIKGHDSSSSDGDNDHHEPSGIKSNIFRLFGREKPVHKVLGGGKPANVFLWRNKKISAAVLGGATVIWILFELLEYHLITLVCHAWILGLSGLFLWSNAANFLNKSPPEIPQIVLPEKRVLQVASALRIQVSRALVALRDVALGKDLKQFLAVIAGLWIFSIIGSYFTFVTFFYIVIILLHTLPLVYEKYEDEIDLFAEKAMMEIKKQYAVFDAKVLSKIPKGSLKDKKKD